VRVRLKHPAGGGEYDLPAAKADDPIYLGRERGLELFVPNGRVSRRHAAFYRTDAGWCVENCSEREGTFVNDVRIDAPHPLAVGDKVTLGEHPPAATIFIETLDDPAPPVDEATHDESEDGGAVDGDETIERLADAAAAPKVRARGRKSALFPIVFGGAMLLLIVGAIGGVAWKARDYRRQVAVAERRVVVAAEIPATRPAALAPAPSAPAPTRLFEDRPRPATERPAPPAPPPVVVPPAVVVTAPGPVLEPPPAPQTPAEIERTTPQWQGVVTAATTGNPAGAIFACAEYRRAVPGTVLRADLDAYTAAALDELWFTRLAELLADRERYADTLAELRAEQKEVTRRQVERTAQLKQQVKEATDNAAMTQIQLEGELAYSDPATPDLTDDARRNAIRAAREPKRYEEWCARVTRRVQETRGASAW
jgi:chorismate mutase